MFHKRYIVKNTKHETIKHLLINLVYEKQHYRALI